MTTKQLEAAVARGAKLLDKKSPGWEKGIKLTKLRMLSNEQCILGQLNFLQKGEGADVILTTIGLTEDEAEKYGFMVMDESKEKDYNLLWKAQVQQRRGKK